MKHIVATTLFFFTSFSYTFLAWGGDEIDGKAELPRHSRFYNKLSLDGLSYASFAYGVAGYSRICDSLHTSFRYLCIADFAKPSSAKRMYIIDTQDSSLLHSDYVSHGKNSGELYAEQFSNEMQSYKSSLGFYLISESYEGKHGYSLRLDGLDRGFNDRARDRAIVMHAAYYADSSIVNATGRLGRSQGCPALPKLGFEKVASIIKEKSVLFIYYPKWEYLSESVWLYDKNSQNTFLKAEGVSNNSLLK